VVTARLWKRGHKPTPQGSGMVCHGRSSELGVACTLSLSSSWRCIFYMPEDFAPKNTPFLIYGHNLIGII
jgi:hypothetical protein